MRFFTFDVRDKADAARIVFILGSYSPCATGPCAAGPCAALGEIGADGVTSTSCDIAKFSEENKVTTGANHKMILNKNCAKID